MQPDLKYFWPFFSISVLFEDKKTGEGIVFEWFSQIQRRKIIDMPKELSAAPETMLTHELQK